MGHPLLRFSKGKEELRPGHPAFPHSFEAIGDARGAARRNQVTGCSEDFKINYIGEPVSIITDLDGPREPVCLYPGSGGAKNEGLGHCAVRVALCVPPDTKVGSA